jgi:2-polyprenyl-6-hydroxyphenyl methylase/3-demethylubiquinone-9 3-methyltransferase
MCRVVDTQMNDLTALESHFRFGENWRKYLLHVDDAAIRQAEAGMLRLVPARRLAGARFIDIGCGSGIHSLAAVRLGAAQVVAIDIDPDSVAATKELLAREGVVADVREESVFHATGQFDVVYSWGVLHHTGDMWRAVRSAAELVRPGGLFAIGLYQQTPSCKFWRKIKRFYSSAARPVQALLRWPYTTLYIARIALSGTNPIRHIRDYKSLRGMNFFTDVHDWLGGYPYESASPEEIISFFGGLGFDLQFDGRLPESVGIFGTGVAQFSFAKRPA